MTETKVKPMSMKKAIYRSINDDRWYWTQEGFSHPVGPFRTREAARQDFRHVMGLDNDNNTK